MDAWKFDKTVVRNIYILIVCLRYVYFKTFVVLKTFTELVL